MTEQTNPNIEKFDLKGHRLFKMSHGFFKKGESWDSGIIELLESKEWISIYRETGKSQGEKFINYAKIGDYVYVCYGGDDLVCFGEIKSDAQPFDDTTDEMIKGDGMWVYRKIEVLNKPVNRSVKDLKKYRKFHMPSGNSTFYEVSAGVLGQANKDLFIPKFGFEIVNSGSGTGAVTAPPPPPEESGSAESVKHPLNQILYGPPGTGKTFHSISRAVAIIEGEEVETIIQECEDGNREDVKNRYNDYVEKGYIQFCTFHQSMAYEDFVEGIKPVIDVPPGITEQSMVDRNETEGGPLRYEIRDGIFKKLCKMAYQNFFGGDNLWNGGSGNGPTIAPDGTTPPVLPTPPVVVLPGAVTASDLDNAYKAFLDHLEAEFKRVNEQRQTGEYRLPAKYGGICIADIRKLRNLYAVIGARGPEEQTSTFENIQLLFIKELYRHYNVEQKIEAPRTEFVRYSLVQRAENDDPNLMAPIQLVLREVASMVGRDQAYFSRPNVGYGLYRYYADFVAGFLMKEDSGVGIIADKRKDSGTIPPIAESPTKQKDDKKSIQPYVLIIDEINRGNVSQIFGELITLIEEDKRLDKPEAIIAELPYSLSKFGVPSNVYMIGTMNTADRSVEALDTALRRRFTFVPMMPEETKLSTTTDGIELVKMLEAINDRLRILKDNDHTIGHAWLMGVKNIGELRIAFGNKILPLLQEYFYNDNEKLGLVLGNEFYVKNEIIKKGVFAKFADSKVLVGQYSKARQYELEDPTNLTIANFQSLYAPNVIVPDAE